MMRKNERTSKAGNTPPQGRGAFLCSLEVAEIGPETPCKTIAVVL